MNLKVKEIFYSLQGEGGRQGEVSIFVRLSGCNLKCDFCDTDFSGGETMELSQILSVIRQHPCRWIIWTGGEPALQLTDEAVTFFKREGYRQAIESNGYFPLPDLLDYTTVSPKGKPDYAKAVNPSVDEVRLPINKGDAIPGFERLPKAKYYFLSPVFRDDALATKENINYCVEQIMQKPDWRLSMQIHKLINIE
ncbi:MAG: 7-carboxy-7-deazaguanine synthase QueE [Dysgonamonadaceae bacterium]|jgi:organic radical activating enzyme|nr:7-carboxy-7-deazaguanine synthase QueE [Dysgonamonadaceae bacterium]